MNAFFTNSQRPVVDCLNVAAGILARSKRVIEGTGADQRPDAKKIPIIAMTANAFKKDKEKCLAAGMNAHLPKPIEIENVKKVLCEQIKP